MLSVLLRFIDSTALLAQWPVQDLNKLEPMHLVLLDSDTQNGLFEIGCCKSVFFLLTSFYLYNEEESIFA